MPYLTKAVPNPEPVDCRILTAALELFVAHGFHSVSVHDVQKLANVSIGSIYNHFGGKEGIAKALYDHLLIEIEQMIEEVLTQHVSATQRCNQILELLFEYTETRRSIITYVFDIRHREILVNQGTIHHSQAFKMLHNIVEQGIKDNEFINQSAQIVNAAIFGAALRMIQLRLEGVIEEPLTNISSQIKDTIWKGVIVKR